jgi:twitching motility protein PilT
MNLREMLHVMIERNASDLHLIRGIPPTLRIYGDLQPLSQQTLTAKDLEIVLTEAVEEPGRRARFLEERELDFAFEMEGRARFRVNAYFQRGSIAFSVRLVPLKIPKLEDLHLPDILREIVRKPNGLVIVTGPTGSGKSTTLAAMMDLINQDQALHVVTVEDPIEYVYEPKKSLVSQREVGGDTLSFSHALRHILRQDPDVILIGEARDLETMQTAITAAETGHLVFTTLHTTSASQTIERIVDVFPPYQQYQIRSQLSVTLQAVITQHLLKRADGAGRIPTTEILLVNPAVRNLIREGKTHQIYSLIELGKEHGMHTMEQDLNNLLARKLIRWEDASTAANVVEYVRRDKAGV